MPRAFRAAISRSRRKLRLRSAGWAGRTTLRRLWSSWRPPTPPSLRVKPSTSPGGCVDGKRRRERGCATGSALRRVFESVAAVNSVISLVAIVKE